MAPVIYNTIVNQKSSFFVPFQLMLDANTPLDLSDLTVSAKYKSTLLTSDTFAHPITVDVTNAVAGEISLSLTPAQTSEMEHGKKYFYDCTTLSVDGFKTRVIEGTLRVDGGVS